MRQDEFAEPVFGSSYARASSDSDPVFTETREAPEKARAVIVITGERRNNHFRVDVCHQCVPLTANSLAVLIRLVLAKAESGTGLVQLPALDIFRLRKALDKNVAPGVGKKLIATGGRQEYALNISRDEVADRVAVTDCFLELVDLKIVTNEYVQKMVEICKSIAIPEKSQRNREEIDIDSWFI